MSITQTIEDLRLVSVEIGTRCPLAPFHKKCPAHDVWKRSAFETMPSDLILRIFREFGEMGYEREFVLSNHNEPACDPRLFWLRDEMGRLCPNARVRFLVCSVMLDRTILKELCERGLKPHDVNAYNDAEYMRVVDEGVVDMVRVTRCRAHDERLHLYDAPKHGSNDMRPCGGPFEHLTILVNGDIVICCRDWKRSVVLANLHKTTLPEFFEGRTWEDVCRRMKAGERWFDVCQRCGWQPPTREQRAQIREKMQKGAQ